MGSEISNTRDDHNAVITEPENKTGADYGTRPVATFNILWGRMHFYGERNLFLLYVLIKQILDRTIFVRV